MYFISNGDFAFPFSPLVYLYKTLYVWSFQTGALNFEGTIRFFSRIPNLIVLYLTGSSVVTSYFYIALGILTSIVSFYLFLRYFLKIQAGAVTGVLVLYSVLNPVFLGNISKIGLNIAVSMLPLLLLFLKIFFEKRRVSYIAYTIFALIISLIHPFTFCVNLFAATLYAFYKVLETRLKTARALIFSALYTLFLGLFIILPLVSIGTLDKDVMANDLKVNTQEINGILTFSNTGGLLNAFAMTKPVLKDYDFYSPAIRPIYITSVFLLYIVVFLFFVLNRKKVLIKDQFYSLIFVAFFGVCLWLSTGNLYKAEFVLNFINDLPGGWAFRSPLKWQLYMPTLFLSFAAIQFKYISLKREKFFLTSLLCLVLLGSSGYLVVEVYHKLLVPKKISVLMPLLNTDLENKRLLRVSGPSCNRQTMGNLNQILISKNVQVKDVQKKNYIPGDIYGFDYVISCSELQADSLRLEQIYPDLYVYSNTTPVDHIYAFDKLFFLGSLVDKMSLIRFSKQHLGTEYNYISTSDERIPYVSLFPLFNGKSALDDLVSEGFVYRDVSNSAGEEKWLYSRTPQFVYADKSNNTDITSKQLATSSLYVVSRINPSVDFVAYKDKSVSLSKNILANPSFEKGIWREKIDNCDYSNNNPFVKVSTSSDSVAGKWSLQLETRKGIACASKLISLKPGQYLLNFEYQSNIRESAVFRLVYNDQNKTNFIGFLADKDIGQWTKYSKLVKVPKGASEALLTLYAKPLNGVKGVVKYDNFSLVPVPNLDDSNYLSVGKMMTYTVPNKVSYTILNPTKKLVHVEGVTTPFYLALNDSFNSNWKAVFYNKKENGFIGWWSPFANLDQIDDVYHFELNSTMNGWFIDTQKYCVENSLCTQNSDGTYNIEIVLEFYPQRWLYFGLLVSNVTFVILIGYLIRRRLRSRTIIVTELHENNN